MRGYSYLLRRGAFITPPIVEALADQGDLGIIVLDAHLDLRDEYGETKFIMPVPAAEFWG